MKKAGLLFSVVLLSLVISVFSLSALSLDDYSGSGYGDPAGIFTLGQDKFVLPAGTNQEIILNLDVAAIPNGYIYKKGYVWNARLADWVAFEFDEPTVLGTQWINGSASGSSRDLTITASNNFQNGINFVVAYACERQNGVWGKWKCGSENVTDVSPNKWMLLMFNISGANWSGGSVPSTICVADAGCNVAAGERCQGGSCVFVPQCVNDSQCSNEQICSDGVCVQCKEDSTCTNGQVCTAGSCANKVIGLGTAASPFMLYDVSDLIKVHDWVYDWGNLANAKAKRTAYYQLARDIDASDPNFQSIGLVVYGYGDYPFMGSFDGNGHVIKNLRTSLFGGVAKGTTIKNLGLVNSTVIGSSWPGRGGLINNVPGPTSIWAGAHEGCNVSNCNVTNVFVIGNISGSGDPIGGMIGTIGDAYYPTAGILIKDSYFKGYVSGGIDSLGGGTYGSAGIIGNVFSPSSTVFIENSYAAVSGIFQGAILGKVWQSVTYNFTSNVYFDKFAKDLCSPVQLSNGFVATYIKLPGCYGNTTAQMKQQATYSTWDFTNTWAIDTITNTEICTDKQSGEICYLDNYQLRLNIRYDGDLSKYLVTVMDTITNTEICTDKQSGEICYLDNYQLRLNIRYDDDQGKSLVTVTTITPAKNDGYPYLKGFNL